VPPNRRDQKGLKNKDMIGIPWRVAFALQADGWYLRQDIIWNKPNPMPESVTDRCTKSHEYIFLLSKKSHYFFDSNAIAEPTTTKAGAKWEERKAAGAQAGNVIVGDKIRNGTQRVVHGKGVTSNLTRHDGLRNKRSVWVVTTKPFRGAHFATFPKDLIEPCVLAGTSEQGCCSKCGAPHVRIIEKGETPNRTPRADNLNVIPGRDKLSRLNSEEMETIPKKTIGWEKTCKCVDAEVVPCVVFDPFTGSGTTAVVALLNGRDYIGTELNPEYIKIAEDRIKDEVPQTLKGMFEQSDTQ
jgi:DNA modification methylase